MLMLFYLSTMWFVRFYVLLLRFYGSPGYSSQSDQGFETEAVLQPAISLET